MVFSMIINTVIIYKICKGGSDAGLIAASISYSITIVGLVSSIDMTYKSIIWRINEKLGTNRSDNIRVSCDRGGM